MISFWRKNRVVITLATTIILIYTPVLISGKVLYWGTTTLQFIPWMNVAIESLNSGQFPLWNPWNGFGAPLFANYQSALLYPLNWSLYIFKMVAGVAGLASGFTFLFVIHLLIAAIGMRNFLKKLNCSEMGQFLGGFLWIFSGYLIGRVSFISMVWSFAWVSWILYAVLEIKENTKSYDLRKIFFLAFLVTMQLLSGHAQTSFYTIITAAILIVFPLRKPWKLTLRAMYNFIAAIILAVALASIQLIPTFEYLLQSQRSTEVGYDYAVNFSFWPLRIISLFFGNFFGNPGLNRFFGGGTFWEDQIYHGIVALFLILILVFLIIRRREKLFKDPRIKYSFVFAVLAIGSLMLAMGKNFFLFPFFYKYIPLMSIFQAPSRFLLIFSLSFTVISAFAFDYWQSNNFNIRKVGLISVGGLAVLIVGIISSQFAGGLPLELRQSIIYSGAIVIIFSIFTILHSVTGNNNKKLFEFGLLAFFVVDLILINFPYGHFVEKSYFEQMERVFTKKNLETLVYMDQKTEEFLKFNRYFRFDRFQLLDQTENMFPLLLPNTNLLGDKIKYVNNFDPFVPNSYNRFMYWLNTLDENGRNTILQYFGVTDVLLLDPSLPTGIRFLPLQSEGLVQWYDCQVSLFANEILSSILYNHSTNSEKSCIFLNAGVQESIQAGQPKSDGAVLLEISQIGSQLLIDYNSANPGWLVVRQTWYPGWKATLENGEKLEILKADFLFQGLSLPAGTHTVKLVYAPDSFLIGAIISISTALIILFVYIWLRKSEKS